MERFSHILFMLSSCVPNESAEEIRHEPRSVAHITMSVFEFGFVTVKSARKLMVELPGTIGLGFCSAAVHDIRNDSLFTAMGLSVPTPWLVKSLKEQVCDVTGNGLESISCLGKSFTKSGQDLTLDLNVGAERS